MGMLNFLFFIVLCFFFCSNPISISIFLIMFSFLISLYSGSFCLFYYNYIILIPILRGLCVLFYYISCICFNDDDDYLVFFLFFYFFYCELLIINFTLGFIYHYSNDIGLCVLIIVYLCFCLVMVIKLCGNL